MTQPNSGWHIENPEVDDGDTGLNIPQYDSEDEVSPSPAIRVDRANQDKNLSSAGAIQFMPKKGSNQRPRAKSQKILPIYQKDALAHTFATASIDVDEISDQMQLNNQDESSDDGSRREAEFHILSDASLDEMVPEADEQKEVSNQNRVELQAEVGPKLKRIRANHDKKKLARKIKKRKGSISKKGFCIGKDTTRESTTGNDIGIELINRAKEVIDEKYRTARRKLRLAEMMGMWK
jgi:hypothetical protein